MGGAIKGLMGMGKRIMNGDKATEVTKQTRSSEADVITWSGCKDSQTSADTSFAGEVGVTPFAPASASVEVR